MSQPKRLLQVCHDAVGAHRELAHCYVVAAEQLGLRVDTVFLREPPCAELAAAVGGNSVRFLDLPRSALKGMKLPLRAQLQGLCAEVQPDVAVAHRWNPMQAVARLPRRMRPGRIVGVAHEMGLFHRAGRRWWQRVFAPGLQVAGVSRAVCEDVAQDNPWLRPPAHLPNVIDLQRAKDELVPCAEGRAQLGLPAEDPLVACVGRLHYKKRPLLALAAFAELLAILPNARLVYLGDGPEREAVTEAAERMGIAHRVTITGWLPGAAGLLPAFDAVLLTSSPAEAFGQVLLEAMVAGAPLVVVDSPGPREVVAQAGLVVPDTPGAISAALARLLAGPDAADLHCRMAEAGAARVAADYDIAALARRLAPLLGVAQ